MRLGLIVCGISFRKFVWSKSAKRYNLVYSVSDVLYLVYLVYINLRRAGAPKLPWSAGGGGV